MAKKAKICSGEAFVRRWKAILQRDFTKIKLQGILFWLGPVYRVGRSISYVWESRYYFQSCEAPACLCKHKARDSSWKILRAHSWDRLLEPGTEWGPIISCFQGRISPTFSLGINLSDGICDGRGNKNVLALETKYVTTNFVWPLSYKMQFKLTRNVRLIRL